MMIYPAITDLMEKFDSRYSFVIATAKIAREIYQTGVTFTECKSNKPVTIAVNEIAENKVTFKKVVEKNVPMTQDEELNKIIEGQYNDILGD